MDDPDIEIRKAARIIAIRCRSVIQSLLRDDERHDCDEEFARIIELTMKELALFKGK